MQHGFCRLWRQARRHLYIEAGGPGVRERDRVHRALKKTAFWAIFAFDTLGPRTYNPRPRCFAGVASEAVFTVEIRRENRRRALFDIVILGRGTRAAARLAIRVKAFSFGA